MTILRLWVLLSLGGLLAGCGQKGPLVLPDAPMHKKATRSAPAAPAPAPAPETPPIPLPGGTPNPTLKP